MIGHYLLTLTPEQEDRVLTTPMDTPMNLRATVPCLVQVAVGRERGVAVSDLLNIMWPRGSICADQEYVTGRYDAVVCRFGAARVNAAIRNRILANRARRTLAPARATAAV